MHIIEETAGDWSGMGTKSSLERRHDVGGQDRCFGRQQGLTLIEVVIAVALAAFLGLSLLTALSALTVNQGKHEERVAAIVAARRQLELVKQSNYDTSVTATPGPAYASLSSNVTIGGIPFDLMTTAQLLETDVQLVTVVASNDGNVIMRLQAYKVNR